MILFAYGICLLYLRIPRVECTTRRVSYMSIVYHASVCFVYVYVVRHIQYRKYFLTRLDRFGIPVLSDIS